MSKRDWMFCPTTGQLLEIDAATNSLRCPRHGHEGTLAGSAHYTAVPLPGTRKQL